MNAKEELNNIEQLKPIEKNIYLAHSYGMNIDNRIHAEEVLEKIVKQFPQYSFYSPIHALGSLYDKLPFDVGMQHCLINLDTCDECWFVQGYDNSRGVNIERQYCIEHNIPMRIIKDCNNCEWNNKIQCGVGFCVLPSCIK